MSSQSSLTGRSASPHSPTLRQSTSLIEKPAFQLALILGLTLFVRLFYMYYSRFATDDAFITFRYARMLAEGQGFVYNPGERVYGTTTPLFTLLMAAWIWLTGAEPLGWARLLTLGAAMGTSAFTWLAVRRLGGSPVQQVLAGLALGLCISQWSHDTSGMETALLPCLMAASWLALTARRYTWAGVICGLLLWVRLDTAFWPLALAAGAFLTNRKGGVRLGLVAAAVYLPWVIFSSLYFGSPIPHTIPAKLAAYVQHGSDTFLANIWTVVKYLTPIPISPVRPGLVILMACLTLGLAVYYTWVNRRSLPVLTLALFALLELVRLAASSATFFNRYFVPLLWAVLVLAGLGLGEAWARLKPAGQPGAIWLAAAISSAVAVGLGALPAINPGSTQQNSIGNAYIVPLWVLLGLFLFLVFSYFKWRGRVAYGLGRPALLLTLAFLAFAGGRQLLPSLKFIRTSQQARSEGALRAMGLWLAEFSPPGSSVLLEPLGYVGYYSGRVMRDEVGLVTPQVTRLKQAGNLDVYTYLTWIDPDYVIQHCDDILGWQERDEEEGNLLGGTYRLAKRFNPLGFKPGDTNTADKNLQSLGRQSCYEIWGKK